MRSGHEQHVCGLQPVMAATVAATAQSASLRYRMHTCVCAAHTCRGQTQRLGPRASRAGPRSCDADAVACGFKGPKRGCGVVRVGMGCRGDAWRCVRVCCLSLTTLAALRQRKGVDRSPPTCRPAPCPPVRSRVAEDVWEAAPQVHPQLAAVEVLDLVLWAEVFRRCARWRREFDRGEQWYRRIVWGMVQLQAGRRQRRQRGLAPGRGLLLISLPPASLQQPPKPGFAPHSRRTYGGQTAGAPAPRWAPARTPTAG